MASTLSAVRYCGHCFWLAVCSANHQKTWHDTDCINTPSTFTAIDELKNIAHENKIPLERFFRAESPKFFGYYVHSHILESYRRGDHVLAKQRF